MGLCSLQVKVDCQLWDIFLRLTGKHWDRVLTAGSGAVAARALADEEEDLAALAAPGARGVVVQAYPVG